MATKTEALDFLISAKDNATGVFKDVEKGLSNIERQFSKLSGLFAVGLGAGMFSEIVHEASKAEEASNRLNAVLKATGFAGGLTKHELDDMADSLAKLTQFEDESVRGAEAVLLKFGNIQGQVFREGLQLSADYAAFTGGDMASAAQAVGKALQSPQEGLKSLQAEMGKLSPTQKAAIEDFMKLNDLAGAQGVVLDFLRGKIAGTAEIMNTGYLGATTSAKKAWNELLESLGRSPAVAGVTVGALELIKRAMQGLDDAVKAMSWENFQAALTLDFKKKKDKGSDPAAERLARLGAEDTKWRDAMDRQALAQRKFADELDEKEKRRLEKEKIRLEKAAADRLAEEKRLFDAGLKGQIAHDLFVIDENERLQRALAKLDEDASDAEDKQRLEDQQKQIRFIDETLDMERALGLAANDGMSMLQQQEKDAKNVDAVARQLGMTFSSAFEDAAIKGKGLHDVLYGIEQDITRLILREAVSKPFAAAITTAVKGFSFSEFFGGGSSTVNPEAVNFAGRAFGGPVSRNTPYLVGENGPELFMPRASGNIVPNGGVGGIGGVSVVQHISIDARSDQASIMSAMAAAKNAAVAAVTDSLRRGGAIGRLARGSA